MSTSSFDNPDFSIASADACAIALTPDLNISCPSKVQRTLAASSGLNLSIAEPKLGISKISKLSELKPFEKEYISPSDLFLLSSITTAPAPSPKSTAVFLSDQSSNQVICSAPITKALL